MRRHTHITESGGKVVHEHDMGDTDALKGVSYDTHTHIVVLSERNWVNEYTLPPDQYHDDPANCPTYYDGCNCGGGL